MRLGKDKQVDNESARTHDKIKKKSREDDRNRENTGASKGEGNREKEKGANTRKILPQFFFWFAIAAFWIWLWQGALNPLGVTTIAYSDFKEYLGRGELVEVVLTETEISGRIASGGRELTNNADQRQADPWYQPFLPPQFQQQVDGANTNGEEPKQSLGYYFRTVRVEDPKLIDELTNARVRFTAVKPSMVSRILWSWLLPFFLILLLWSLIARRFSQFGASPFALGKNRAKLLVDKFTGVSFEDVAGCDEAKNELKEVVDFLKEPERYKRLGASVPKGILLVGPPGTGKTLLARAVAGEAKVPFFAISGADFIEMFVGVGAARVRDLFAQAQKQAPCIVFIDEIDSIGRVRSVQAGVAHDEREQTLNQLLSEMDGFEANRGIIVLAATNRPEVLDPAILRPGRFDRQVVIDAPDKSGRIEILKVHSRGKPLAPDVALEVIAQATPGFSGADLANLINEAALLATRRQRQTITQKDFLDSVDKVVAGPERKSRRLGDEERRRIAYHESGHALVAAFCKEADPVHKISIVPRGKAALGYTMQLPERDRFILTKGAILDKIRGLMGGRAAEELIFDEVSTGAENDLDKATALAEQMICFYGMGRAGLTHYGERRPLYLIQAGMESITKNCSPVTARKIDEEVEDILERCYLDAKEILMTHRETLDLLAGELLKRETIEAGELSTILPSLNKKVVLHNEKEIG